MYAFIHFSLATNIGGSQSTGIFFNPSINSMVKCISILLANLSEYYRAIWPRVHDNVIDELTVLKIYPTKQYHKIFFKKIISFPFH